MLTDGGGTYVHASLVHQLAFTAPCVLLRNNIGVVVVMVVVVVDVVVVALSHVVSLLETTIETCKVESLKNRSPLLAPKRTLRRYEPKRKHQQSNIQDSRVRVVRFNLKLEGDFRVAQVDIADRWRWNIRPCITCTPAGVHSTMGVVEERGLVVFAASCIARRYPDERIEEKTQLTRNTSRQKHCGSSNGKPEPKHQPRAFRN